MFCLECGSEMAIRARACPVCGHVYGDRERSMAEASSAHPTQGPPKAATQATAIGSAAHVSASAQHAADRGASATGLPHDLPGRFVLAVSLGLAADLLLPWVSVNSVNVTPASIGAPVVVVVALLAAATLPVFTLSLRQHPVWSALPLMVGAFCAGVAGSIWLLLAPLTQIFAISFGSDPSNLALSPQAGLYLFVLGSAVLLVSGQRMLAAMREAQLSDARRDAMRSMQARQAASARSAAPTVPTLATSAQMAQMAQLAIETIHSQSATPAGQMVSTPAADALPHSAPTPPSDIPVAPIAPVAPAAPVVPVLPGSDAWHQAPAAPSPVRPAPSGGWGRSRGPQRLR